MGLRLKVALIFLVALLVYLPILYFGVSKYFSDLANDQMVKHGRTFCMLLADEAADLSRRWPADEKAFQREVAAEFARSVAIAATSGIFSVRKILLVQPDFRVQCAHPVSEVGRSYPDDDVAEAFRTKDFDWAIERSRGKSGAEIDLNSYLSLADGSGRVLEVKLAFSETEKLLAAGYRGLQLVAVVGAGLSFASLLLIMLVLIGGSVIEPARLMSRAMSEVGQGNLDVGIRVRSRDEFGQMAAAFNGMVVDLKEKLHLSSYVSGATRAAVRRGVAEGTRFHAPQRKRATVFFSDVRGFTAFSERRDPGEVIAVLNRLLALQSEIIREKGGDIDKFVGDQTMAIFEDVADAVDAGLEIQAAVSAMADGVSALPVGVGLVEGEVVAGDVGSEDMKDFTVIGDCVNTAARIQQAAAGGEVLVCEALALDERIQARFLCEKKGDLALKGKERPLGVWVVRGRRKG